MRGFMRWGHYSICCWHGVSTERDLLMLAIDSMVHTNVASVVKLSWGLVHAQVTLAEAV